MNNNCMKIIITALLYVLASSFAYAHNGESHGSSPSASSSSKFGNSVEGESPLSMGVKLRSGFEYGPFTGVLPNLNSYLGSEEINLTLNYEFQVRQFSSELASDFPDRDFNNHLSASSKKILSESLVFALTGEYEKRQAVRISRMINDYNYAAVNPSLNYKLNAEWTVVGALTFSSRQFPNGTYLLPSSSPTGAGEPIVPGTTTPATGEVTLVGVTDNQNEAVLSINGDFGGQSLNLESKFISNDSDLNTRKYSGQSLKLAVEKLLWSRILAQISYGVESRDFSDHVDRISTTELGLQKEMSARMSISALFRNNEIAGAIDSSTGEGYAQLQYVF